MEPNQISPVVVAEKIEYKGRLFGAISNGNAILPISHGIAIKFIALNENYVTIQILNGGIGVPIKSQSWIKTKTIIKAPEVPKLEIPLETYINKERKDMLD